MPSRSTYDNESSWFGGAANAVTDAADVAVDGTVGGVTVLAANVNRKGAIIQNTGSANMRVTVNGSAAAANRGIQVPPGGLLNLSAPFCPTGVVKAIREGGVSTTAAAIELT